MNYRLNSAQKWEQRSTYESPWHPVVWSDWTPRDRILTYAFFAASGSVVEISHPTQVRFSGRTHHAGICLKFPAMKLHRADPMN